MEIDKNAYMKFLEEEIEVAAGKYTRAHLLAMATSHLDVPVNRLAPMFPGLKLVATANVDKAIVPDTGAVDVGAPIVMDSVADAIPDVPWDDDDHSEEHVDAKDMIEVLRHVQWSSVDPPRGRPGLMHVFEVLAWIRGQEKYAKQFMAALFGEGKEPKLAKNLNEVSEVIAHMPVYDVARWFFTVAKDAMKPKALHEAYAEINVTDLVTQLWDWGFDVDGVREGTEADRAMRAHQFMAAIAEGTRTDGVYKTPGSCAAIMKALKAVHDTLPAEQRVKMHDHIVKHYDADKIKAMAPLMKILNSKEMGDVGTLICQLLSKGDVPVAVLAMVFTGEWDRLYSSLLSCLDTIGPRPPWLNASAA